MKSKKTGKRSSSKQEVNVYNTLFDFVSRVYKLKLLHMKKNMFRLHQQSRASDHRGYILYPSESKLQLYFLL